MAKEIKGWRGPKSWDMDDRGDVLLGAIKAMTQSDDGWYCPHCMCKSDLYQEEGISNETYVSLMENFDPIEMVCHACDQKYFLKCCVRKLYFSCEDKEFKSD